MLVDDRSTDATAAIMERHRAAAPYPVRVVRNRQPPEGCTGKQQALDLGVAEAAGELLRPYRRGVWPVGGAATGRGRQLGGGQPCP